MCIKRFILLRRGLSNRQGDIKTKRNALIEHLEKQPKQQMKNRILFTVALELKRI